MSPQFPRFLYVELMSIFIQWVLKMQSKMNFRDAFSVCFDFLISFTASFSCVCGIAASFMNNCRLHNSFFTVVTPDQVRVTALQTLRSPNSKKKELRSILGSFLLYGSFIQGYASLVAPLYD